MWVMPGQIDSHAHVAGLARGLGPGAGLRDAGAGGDYDGGWTWAGRGAR